MRTLPLTPRSEMRAPPSTPARAASLREVVGTGAHDELVVLAGERAAGREQRSQHRDHLLRGAMAQRNHLDRLLRQAGSRGEGQCEGY
jgi:hypothetical protein